MTDSLEAAEQMVVELIASANQVHTEATWRYELTSEVENIEVVSRAEGTHTAADPPVLAPLRRRAG